MVPTAPLVSLAKQVDAVVAALLVVVARLEMSMDTAPEEGAAAGFIVQGRYHARQPNAAALVGYLGTRVANQAIRLDGRGVVIS